MHTVTNDTTKSLHQRRKMLSGLIDRLKAEKIEYTVELRGKQMVWCEAKFTPDRVRLGQPLQISV